MDLAKAVTILLIVVFHVSTWFVWDVVPESALFGAIEFWATISLALIPVRIPLFFLVSGFLAQQAVWRSWPELVRTRFVGLLWPFLLWGLLIVLPWSYRVNPAEPLANASTSIYALLLGGTHYWFLPTLVVVIALARALRRVPVIALVVTAITSLAVTTNTGILVEMMGPYLGINVSRWLDCAVWFMIGCFLPKVVGRVARMNALWAVVGVAVFVGLRSILVLDIEGIYPVVLAALTLTGVASLVIASRFASASLSVSRFGAYFAARTLPIYVTHAFVLEVLAAGSAWARTQGWMLTGGAAVEMLFVPVVVVAVTGASVALHSLSRRQGFAWLYAPPAPLLAWMGSRASERRREV